MITDGPLPGPAGPALHGPSRSCPVHRHAPALAGLTGNCQELEVPAADSAFQRADDRARIVVRTGDIQRLAILTEGDRCPDRSTTRDAPRRQRSQGAGSKPRLTCVRNGTKHHLAGQLDGRLKRIAVVPREKVADEPPQTKIVHDFRAEGVFHPQTVNVGEIAADRDLAVPVLASDQHRDQAVGPRCRILVQRPARSDHQQSGQHSRPG